MNGERGYTFVELMLAILITGVIAMVLGMVVQQMVTVPEQSNDQVQTLHALQNAIHFIGLDAGSAESATGGNTLTLTMPDDIVISYERSGNVLCRYIDDKEQFIATGIISMNFTVSDRTVYMSITAAPEGRWDISKSRNYQIAMRPTGS